MNSKKDKAVLVKHWKELSLFSWFLHLFILIIGLFIVGIVIVDWVNSYLGNPISENHVSSALSLVAASIAILFGLAPFLHPKWVLFSLSLLFLFGAWNGLESGQIDSGKHCCTIFREKNPFAFYFWVTVHFLIFVAGAIWAWTVKPASHNQNNLTKP
jgi:hypothetical protein